MSLCETRSERARSIVDSLGLDSESVERRVVQSRVGRLGLKPASEWLARAVRMSLAGLVSGAECAVQVNPLSQVLKHTDGDRSLQQVRLLASAMRPETYYRFFRTPLLGLHRQE